MDVPQQELTAGAVTDALRLAQPKQDWDMDTVQNWDDVDRDVDSYCLWGEESDIIVTRIG